MEPNNERKTPAGEQNELFKKQVFSDETLRTADPCLLYTSDAADEL